MTRDLRFVYSLSLSLAVSGLPAYGPVSHVTSDKDASHQPDFIETVTLSGIALTVTIVLLALCVKGRKEEAKPNDGVQDLYAVPNKKAKKQSKRDENTQGQGTQTGDDVMQDNALYTEYKESKKVSRKVQKPKTKKQKKTEKTEAVYENVEHETTGNATERPQDVYATPKKKAKKKTKRPQKRQAAQTYENVEI